MRKIGIVCAALGAVIALALGIVRHTDWFALEQVRSTSEAKEFVISFFWAGAALCVVGVTACVVGTWVGACVGA